MIERPSFDRVDAPDRGFAGEIGREAVYRLGRQRDDAAGGQQARGVNDYRGVDGGTPRTVPSGSIEANPAYACSAGGMSMPPSAR